MSSRLYSTRLWWYGVGGGAKLHGFEVALKDAPVISGEVVKSIDYVPEIGLHSVQFVDKPMRELTHDEITQCDVILRRVCAPVSEW